MGDLVVGMRYVGRGQRWVARNGRWYGFGLLPALITLVLYTVALVVLAFWADDLAAWATPFADDWDETWRSALRISVLVLFFAAGLLLAVLTFTAVTLLIGDPFYEALSQRVEESEGGAPAERDNPWWRELWTSLTDSVHVLVRLLALAIPLFVLGFVPFIGQTVVPVLGFAVSGFFLTVELTSVAMQRRGIPVRERLRLLRTRKPLALGFGVPLVLCFLIPPAAVFLMPGAVAGATLLVRDLVGGDGDENDENRDNGGSGGKQPPPGPPWHPQHPQQQWQPGRPPQGQYGPPPPGRPGPVSPRPPGPASWPA